jgi:hypothetical protein
MVEQESCSCAMALVGDRKQLSGISVAAAVGVRRDPAMRMMLKKVD